MATKATKKRIVKAETPDVEKAKAEVQSDSLKEFMAELRKQMVAAKLSTTDESAANFLRKGVMGKCIAKAFDNIYE